MNDSFESTALAMLLESFSPLLVLLVAAVVALMVSAFARRENSRLEPAIALAGILIAMFLGWYVWPRAGAVSVPAMAMDRLALAGLLIACVPSLMVVLISPAYFAARNAARPGFYSLVLLATFGMGTLMACRDLISILLALMLMSMALYALVAFLRGRPQSVEGALKFFIMSAFAAAFYCMGMAFIFGSLGSTDLSTIAHRFDYVLSGEGRSVFLFGLAMVSSGLALMVTAVPFHAWAPDTLDGSPTPVALLIATSAKAATLVAFLRLAMSIAAPGGVLWHHLAWGISAATMLWGALASLGQSSLKRLLAYISISNAGFLMMALPSLAIAGEGMTRALLMYLIAYCVSMAGAYAALVSLGLTPGEPVDVRHLSGLAKRRPWLSAGLTLFLLSLAGLPPTLGFFGKYYLIYEAAGAGDISLAAVAGLASVISLVSLLKPVSAMYLREAVSGRRAGSLRSLQVHRGEILAVMLIMALAVVFFGLLPGNLLAFVYSSAL